LLFRLKNPHKVPARSLGLKAKQKDETIYFNSDQDPHFSDIMIWDNCNTKIISSSFGDSYTNNTGLDGNVFFTGSVDFQVKEIDVFEITDASEKLQREIEMSKA
jgi:hypothetical protein